VSSELIQSGYSRSFWAFFVTQFSGAFNDNFYKSALLMLFTYGGVSTLGLGVDVINNLVAAILIVPFLLLAPLAGQWGDKFERVAVMRQLKLLEVALMIVGAIGVWQGWPLLLLVVLFLMGSQSACFSPIKYSSIPALVEPSRVVAANGLIHAGTNLAIFSGLICGSLMMALPWAKSGMVLIALCLAIVGWLSSRLINPLPVASGGTALFYNPLRQLRRSARQLWQQRLLLVLVLALSWYWFMGSFYLAQVPNLAKSVLRGEPLVVTLLLLLFLLGVCISAVCCRLLTDKGWRTRWIPLGGLGVALAGFDLSFACQQFAVQLSGDELLSVSQWLSHAVSWRVMFDIAMVGACGGVYMVPLLSLLQQNSPVEVRSQMLAANTVVNALFMVLASVVAGLLLGGAGMSIPEVIGWVSLAHLCVVVVVLFSHPQLRRWCVQGLPENDSVEIQSADYF
jgi:MFS family permease